MMVVLFTGTLALAEPTPKDELIDAAKQLAAKGNYTWVTTVGSQSGTAGGAAEARMRMGPTDGKTADGVTHLVLQRGDKTFQAASRGKRRIIETDKGWRPLASVASQKSGGKPADPTVAIARMLQGFEPPAVHAQELAAKAGLLMRSGDTFTGELTEEGARSLLVGAGIRAGRGVSDVKGKISFWTKDGVLVRYEYTVQASVSTRGGDRRLIEQTTATSVTDIGSTRIALSPEARLKIP